MVRIKKHSGPVQGGAVVVIRIMGAAAQLVLVGSVAYFYSIEDVGLNGVLWTVAIICRTAGALGVDSFGMKTQAPLWDNGNLREASAHARKDTFIVMRRWLITLGVVLFFVFVAYVIFGQNWAFLIVLALVGCSSTMTHLFVMQRQAKGWPVIGQVVETLLLPALGTLGAVVNAGRATPYLIGSQLVAFFVVSIVMFALSPSRLNRAGQVSVQTESDKWSKTLPLATGAMLTALSSRAPMLFMGASSLSAAGAYDVAQRIQSGGALGTTAVSTVYMPKVVVDINCPRRLRRHIVEAACLSTIAPTLLLVGAILLGPQAIVEILGSDYSGVWGAAVILLGASLLNAITSAMSNVIMFNGKDKAFALIASVQLLIVLMFVMLLDSTTPEKMALAVLAGELFRSACLIGQYHSHLQQAVTR